MTELKILGAYLSLAIMGIVGFIAAMLVIAMVGGGAMMAAGGNAQVGGITSSVMMLALFGLYALWIWISVRFSLIASITVATKKFALGASWTATKGRFWTLLDLTVVTTVRWIFVYVAMLVVLMMVMGGVGGMTGAAQASDMVIVQEGAGSTGALDWVAIGVFVVTVSLFFALTFTIMTAPFAAFYRDVIAAKPVQEPAA